MKQTARIERNPLVYHVDNPPPSDYPMWTAWDDKTGEVVAYGLGRKECTRFAELQGYETRLFLRAGDDGKERRHPNSKFTWRERLTNLLAVL